MILIIIIILIHYTYRNFIKKDLNYLIILYSIYIGVFSLACG